MDFSVQKKLPALSVERLIKDVKILSAFRCFHRSVLEALFQKMNRNKSSHVSIQQILDNTSAWSQRTVSSLWFSKISTENMHLLEILVLDYSCLCLTFRRLLSIPLTGCKPFFWLNCFVSPFTGLIDQASHGSFGNMNESYIMTLVLE